MKCTFQENNDPKTISWYMYAASRYFTFWQARGNSTHIFSDDIVPKAKPFKKFFTKVNQENLRSEHSLMITMAEPKLVRYYGCVVEIAGIKYNSPMGLFDILRELN